MTDTRLEIIDLLIKTIYVTLSPTGWEKIFGEEVRKMAPRQALQITITPEDIKITVVDAESTDPKISDANWEMEKALKNIKLPPKTS